MKICKKCCCTEFDSSLSSVGICELCGQLMNVISTYLFDDEIDRLFYFDIGGEG